MNTLIEMVYPIFAREYFLHSDRIETKEIENTLNTLFDEGLLVSKETGFYCRPENNDDRIDQYLSLSNICEPSLKRFYITMSVLWDKGHISMNELRSSCDAIAKRLETLEGWPYPEFSDKTKFQNFLEFLIAEKYITEDKEKELFAASKITVRAQESYKKFFDKKFIDLIQNIN